MIRTNMQLLELKKPNATLARILPEQDPRPGVRYVPSQYALSFSHRGKAYVYHTLTGQLVEAAPLEAGEWNEGNEALIRGLFLVPNGKDECAYYNSISSLMRTLKQKPANQGFVILPTLRCNARCVYCYEEGREQSTMTPDNVERTLRYIIDTHRREPIWISWFGGEPLLCPDIIDRICAGLQEAGLEYRCGVVSNGSLITPAIVDKMTGPWNIKQIQISMDGAETDYIARKNYRVYRDYYHSVMESISRMSEAGIDVTIRCNVEESNWDGIPRFLEDLREGVSNKEHVRLYFCALNHVRASEDDVAMWKKIVEARPLIAAAGFNANNAYGSGMSFRVFHCMADGNTVVIEPDGSLYPCEHCPPEGRFGNIWDETVDETHRAAFCRADRTFEKCRDCPFLPICTNFSNCPTKDRHCRQVRELTVLDDLRWYIDHRVEENLEPAEADETIC